jgi:hypothetical protein
VSRKNKRYGEQWLEQHFDLFCQHKWYSVHAWTHRACGPWWTPQSSTRIERYEVARFKTLEEYKAWRRKKAKNWHKTRRILRAHGVKV